MPSAADKPLAIWRVFHEAPQWWLARGCPPTVAHLSGWTRVLHVSVLLSAMGLAAATLGAALIAAKIFRSADGWCFEAIYAGVVLVPLSRWTGRSAWQSLLTIPAMIAWFWSVVALVEWMISLRGTLPEELQMLVVCAYLALGPALWMAAPRTSRCWSVVSSTLLACMLAVASAALLHRTGIMSSRTMPMSISAVRMVLWLQPWVMLFTLTAAALGIPLWKSEAQRVLPRPAANTDFTSTANPGSSTEVAVSPGLNSP